MNLGLTGTGSHRRWEWRTGAVIAEALSAEGAGTGLIGRPGEKLQAAAELLGGVAVPVIRALP